MVPDAAATEHADKTTVGANAIQADSPLYYSYDSIGGVEKKLYATEAEVLAGG